MREALAGDSTTDGVKIDALVRADAASMLHRSIERTKQDGEEKRVHANLGERSARRSL